MRKSKGRRKIKTWKEKSGAKMRLGNREQGRENIRATRKRVITSDADGCLCKTGTLEAGGDVCVRESVCVCGVRQ